MVKERTDYSDRAMRATHSVLLEVIHLLKDFENSIILVGGLVPILLLPDAREKHVGTIDVDLALDPRQLSESSSSTIKSILLDNGYKRGDEQGRYYRTIDIIVAFIVMKAHALELRDKSKDAYQRVKDLLERLNQGSELGL